MSHFQKCVQMVLSLFKCVVTAETEPENIKKNIGTKMGKCLNAWNVAETEIYASSTEWELRLKL